MDMGTRGQIRITGLKALLYKHYDANPEEVLPTLVPFVARFWAARGFDSEYFLLRCAAEFLREEAEFLKKYNKDPKEEVLGLGIVDRIHGDIAFMYTVLGDGTIRVEVPVLGPKDFEIMSFRTIGVIPLGSTVDAAMKGLNPKKGPARLDNVRIKGLLDAGVL
jgi:hypothetical protein